MYHNLLFFIQFLVIAKCTKHLEYYDQEESTNETISASNEVDEAYYSAEQHEDPESPEHYERVEQPDRPLRLSKNGTTVIETFQFIQMKPSHKVRPSHQIKDNKSSTTLINYPFAVSVQRKGAHYTTGALIDKKWILSSAGEFYNVRESIKLFRARLGSVNCKRGGTVVPLKKIEIHPSYIYGQPNFDVSLLKLAHPVVYSNFIKPIQFSKVRTKVIGAKFLTTYWPRIVIKGVVLPGTAKERIKKNSLRVSTQRLIPRDKCIHKMNSLFENTTLHDSALCLKPFITHHSMCLPDAGAPVVAEDGLWGITSGWTSKDCLTKMSPTIFTRVSSLVLRVWLDSQMAHPTK